MFHPKHVCIHKKYEKKVNFKSIMWFIKEYQSLLNLSLPRSN